MGKWLKRIPYILLAILLLVGIVLLWRSCSKSKSEDYSDVVTHAMTIRSIEEILKLSTGECYQEIPMVDTIDGMVLAYVIQARTYIDFDIELSSLQVFDSQMLFEKFSSKKYEIGSIAKQVEMLYLLSLIHIFAQRKSNL